MPIPDARSAARCAESPAVSVRRALADTARTVLRADLAIAYCGIVAALTVYLNVIDPEDKQRIIEETSSNLANLRDHPVQCLLTSAFVVPRPVGLVLVAMLLVVLAYAQRFIGRAAALIVGLSGHVGATIIVATALESGIFHQLVDPSVRTATDVGVSYVLACSMGFLTLFVPGRRRWLWCAGLAIYWLLPGAFERSFTAAGHASALSIGWLMAFVCWRAVDAHLRQLGRGPEWRG
jgi:hypothetical protein